MSFHEFALMVIGFDIGVFASIAYTEFMDWLEDR